MPQAFVHLTPELDHACSQDVVLTTTERLRRNLALGYSEARLAEGRAAWVTPQIRTFDGYLAELHEHARLDAGVPALLSAEAEFELFRTTAPAGLERLIPLARDAWRLCRHWQIELTGANLAATEQGRLFLDWAERVQRRLDGDHSVTRADLPAIGAVPAGASRLCCLAFEHTPRAYEAWLERARTAGIAVTHLASPVIPNQTTERISFDTAATELAAIAAWARETLLESPDARIGVVVPDLSRRYQAVVRQFTAELDPLLETGTEGLVDVGGGMPLAEQPVWRAASQWLTLCLHRLPLEAARQCLNSPYLDLPRLPRLPDAGPPLVDLGELAHLIRAPRLAELARRRPAAAPKVLGAWLEAFRGMLDLAGWPGQDLGSVQYQAQADARARIERLASGRGGRVLSPTAALDVLQQYLSSAIFAPERSPASIQIMGYLETTGLAFTHLWVSGLDDQCWPQPLTLNPFVPAATQRRLGLPRASPTLETAFAADRLAHWRSSAAHLIVSHARHAGETRLRPSPLIADFRQVSRPGLAGQRPHPAFVQGHGQLEVVDDPRGLPSSGGAQRGGTTRIRDQALCPFRGYAIHRLLLKEPRAAHGLPDPLDRGLAIHDALHRLYAAAGEHSKTPADLTPEDFERAADASLERNFTRFPESYRLRERDRLTLLLDAWNRLECEGISDGIEALEATRDVDFGDLGLTLRVDRIDRLGDALIVIDYKTGRIGGRLDRERLVEPQLPLYALTNDRIRGVLYAEVDEVRPRLQGISALPIAPATVKPPAGGSWSAQIDTWRRKLDVLIEEIRDGYAAVAPFDASACQNCHLGGFCRVGDGSSE